MLVPCLPMLFFSFCHSVKNNPHAFLPHSETLFCKSIVVEDGLSKGCRGFDVSTFVVHITTNKDVAIIISEICILEVNCWNHRQRESPLQAMIQYWYNHLWDYHTHCWLHRENTQVNDHHLRGFFSLSNFWLVHVTDIMTLLTKLILIDKTFRQAWQALIKQSQKLSVSSKFSTTTNSKHNSTDALVPWFGYVEQEFLADKSCNITFHWTEGLSSSHVRKDMHSESH